MENWNKRKACSSPSHLISTVHLPAPFYQLEGTFNLQLGCQSKHSVSSSDWRQGLKVKTEYKTFMHPL